MNWYKTLIALSLVATAAAVAPACGGGGSGGSGGAGGGGSQSSSGSAQMSSSSASSSSSSASSSSSSASTSSSSGMDGGAGACNNPDDKMKLMDQMTATAAAGMCGQMCALDPNKSKCAAMCMQMKMMISQACSQCWGDTIACGIDKCLNQCIADPNSPMCMMCTATNCEPAFHMCAGI